MTTEQDLISALSHKVAGLEKRYQDLLRVHQAQHEGYEVLAQAVKLMLKTPAFAQTVSTQTMAEIAEILQ